MDRQQLRTLQSLFAHPLAHGVKGSEAEALCRALGAEVERIDDHRLRIRMPAGQESWIRLGSGFHHLDLDAEAVKRLRHLLEEAGVSPDHPLADANTTRGDISRRLVLVLEHAASRAFLLEGDTVEEARLRPHGLWGSGENLSHRHDRDIAGQRAPLDNDYLRRLTAAIAAADAVLLLGHGHGESNLCSALLQHLEKHRPDLVPRISGCLRLDTGAMGERGVLAVARRHFGNLPHRRPVLVPGQQIQAG
jgi:hypothetical protein